MSYVVKSEADTYAMIPIREEYSSGIWSTCGKLKNAYRFSDVGSARDFVRSFYRWGGQVWCWPVKLRSAKKYCIRYVSYYVTSTDPLNPGWPYGEKNRAVAFTLAEAQAWVNARGNGIFASRSSLTIEEIQ